MSNGNVGWYYVNSAIPSYRIRGLTPGTTILQIRDSVGKVVQVRVEVVDPDYTDVLSILESMDNAWIALFAEMTGTIGISSTEADGVEVNASNDTLCELNNTGRKYYRPIHASCVTNDPYNAWKCEPGYVPVGSNGGYSCISSGYVSMKNMSSGILRTISFFNTATEKSIERSRNSLATSNAVKKMTWLNNSVSDTLKKYYQSEAKYIYTKDVLRLGILTEATDYKLAKLYTLYDIYKGELNAYRLQIELAILKNNYERIQVQKGYQIAKGNQDGYEQAVKDYLEEIKNILDPTEFVDLLLGIAKFAYNIEAELSTLPSELAELKDIYQNRHEIFAGLDDYTRQYYTTYIETSVALELIPFKGGKLSKFKTSRSSGVMEKVRLFFKLKSVQFSQKALERMNQTGRFIPVQTLKQVIVDGIKRTDPQGSRAMMYYHKITKNGQEYNVEVLYDGETNSIWHFMYTDKPIGPLGSTN